MERLVEMRSGHCVFLRSDPAYEPRCRGRPRYEAIVARVFAPSKYGFSTE